MIALDVLQVVPNPGTALGWTLRGTVLDLVHVFEVNRKESARILLSLVRYFSPGTFKSSAPCPTDGDAEVPTSTLSIESLIISTILGAMFLLPISPCKSVYYGSVITELCKSSPNTVAPPVGRSVRRLFTMMGGEGLDIEIIRRTAEWFAIHLSNFGFQWMWKEW
jgi:nuclear cap-binding protein subunit 1